MKRKKQNQLFYVLLPEVCESAHHNYYLPHSNVISETTNKEFKQYDIPSGLQNLFSRFA